VYVLDGVPEMPRFEKVATPPDAVAVTVPTKVPPALMEAVTTVVESVTKVLEN
jgi:hypothetical protein